MRGCVAGEMPVSIGQSLWRGLAMRPRVEVARVYMPYAAEFEHHSRPACGLPSWRKLA